LGSTRTINDKKHTQFRKGEDDEEKAENIVLRARKVRRETDSPRHQPLYGEEDAQNLKASYADRDRERNHWRRRKAGENEGFFR